jgi:hypothetical protein
MFTRAKRLRRKIATMQESSRPFWKMEGMGFLMHAIVGRKSKTWNKIGPSVDMGAQRILGL